MAAPIRLGITIHADGSAQVSGELNRVRGGLNETDRATQSANRSFAQMARETLSLKAVIAGFAASLSALALFQTTKELIRTADNMTLLDGRIKIATSSQADYINSSKELVAISLRTGTSFEANATIFSRINKAMEQMGGTTAHTTALTETLAQSLRISGTSAGEAASVIRQMSQALASGVLRGDEFNSLMENSPRLAQAMADGMHVNIGSLRAMAEAGELTSKRVITAIQSQADVIDEEFKRIPLTVGSALENVNTAFSQYILAANSSSGATFELAHTINTLAENLPLIINGMVTVGKVAAIIFVGSAISGIAGYLQAMASARAEAAALASTIAAASAANLAQAEALVVSSQAAVAHASATAADLQVTQAMIVAVRAQSLAQFSATNQQILRTRAEITALSTTIQTTATIYLRVQAEAALAVAEARRAALQADLAMLGTQYSAVSAKVTEALAAQTAANVALAEAETALTAAQTGLTASTVSFGASLKALLTPLNLINVGLAAFVGWEVGKWLNEFPTIAGMAAISMGFFAKVVESFNFHLAVNEARLTGNSEAIAGLRAEHEKAVAAIDSNVQGTVLFIESQGQAAAMSIDLKQALAALKTPQEVYSQKVLETNEALKSNLITQEQATSLLAKYKETLDQANASMKETPFTKELDKQIDRLNKATLSAKEYDRATFKKAGFSGNELDSLMAKSGAADAAEAQIAATKKLASERKAAADAEERAMKSLTNQYESMAAALLKKNALAANSGTLAELEYDIEFGALKKLTDAQKLFLLQQTKIIYNRELDAKKAEIEKTEMDSLIDKYNQLTLSAREYYSLTLLKKGIEPDKQAPLLKQFDKNTATEAQQKSIESARTALEAYNTTLDSTQSKMNDLGATSSDIFNGALGGVNTLSGAFESTVESIQANTQALNTLHKKQAENVQFEKLAITDLNKRRNPEQYQKDLKAVADNKSKYIAEEAELSNERLLSELGGIRQIASATGQMFAENTTARKAFNLIALAASVAERAADLAGLGVKAASAVLTQGQGDPYTAFARIAAMAAIVASVIAAAGGGAFQFGGSTATPPKPTADTGTVLGDPNAPSESIDKTYQLLKDIHAEEYAELRGINSGISALASGITNTTTRLFQTGGLKDVNVNTASQWSNSAKTAYSVIQGVAMAAATVVLGPIGGALVYAIGKSKDLGMMAIKFLIGGIFGKISQKVVGGGIYTNPTGLGSPITGQQYTTIETTKKSWFSKKVTYDEILTPLDVGVRNALTDVFRNIGNTVNSLADVLFQKTGISVKEKVAAYIIPALRIELFGLTGEQSAKKLSGVLSATTDRMATKIFGSILGKYQQLGEGMLQTVTRVVSEIAIVQDAMKISGREITVDVIALSDAIVQAAGGIEQFQKTFSAYYDNFFSAEEKQKNLKEKLAGQLTEFFSPDQVAAVLASRDAYRSLFESIDVTKPASHIVTDSDGNTYSELNKHTNQEAYSALLALSEQANAYYSGLEEASNAAANAAKEAADKIASIALQQHDLDIQLMDATGDSVGALAARRADELAALDESLRGTQQAIWAAQDYTKSHQEAVDAYNKQTEITNKIMADQRKLDIELMDATGNAAGALKAKRDDEIMAMDVSLRITQMAIWAAQDLNTAQDAAAQSAKEAADKLASIALQQRDLDIQLMDATGDSVAALAARRADELAALDESLRGTQQAIWAAQDLKTAQDAATESAKSATQTIIDGLSKQLDDLTVKFGDLNDPIETVSAKLNSTKSEMENLASGLNDLLNITAKSDLEKLKETIGIGDAITGFMDSLSEAIFNSRLAGLSASEQAAVLKQQEDLLWSQLSFATDPVATAQKLQQTIIARIQAEAKIKSSILDDENNKLTLAADLAKKARTEQIATLNSQLDSMERIKKLAEDIDQFTKSLQFSDISPLDYQSQLSAAQGLYESALAGAARGNETDIGNLTGNAKAYLDEARTYYASSADYASIFGSVVSALDALGVTGAGLDPQITALQAQIESLNELNEQTLTLKDTVISTSVDEVISFTRLDGTMRGIQLDNQKKADEQVSLIKAQMEQLQAIAEAQQAQITQAAAIAESLRKELEKANAKLDDINNNQALAAQAV